MKRRDILTGMLAGTAALALPLGLLRPTFGAPLAPQTRLRVIRRSIEVNGKAASVFGLEGPDGLSGLHVQAGDNFNVLLANDTAEPTIVHWHGLTPPWASDGVADMPLPLIAGGAQRSFDFPVGKPGTYWMHAHTLQEQSLLAAPLIIVDPADAQKDEQEVIIQLHDFSFQTPEELFAKLSKGKPMIEGAPPSINDIDYDGYLANDRTLADPEIVAVERGGNIRVRIINGATSTAFTIDFGALVGELIAVDGQDIEPVKGSRFPLTMGQRMDVRLKLPNNARAFPILALREGALERTGIILKPAGAKVAKLAGKGRALAPLLDLTLEASLKSLAPLAVRKADKAFDMSLNGDMATYHWSIDTSAPILADLGDRVEVTIMNGSQMAHPMHLHGHHFQVVGIDDTRFAGAVRDTVLLPPLRSVTIAIDANNPGDQWAFHCHHLYHLAAGMMSTFQYKA